MKKILLGLILLIFVSGTAFSQITFGVAGVAGTKAGIDSSIDDAKINFGAHARILASINDNLGFVAGFTYFLPSEAQLLGGTDEATLMEFNADLHYYLVNEAAFKFYGLGGAVFSSLKKVTSAGSDTGTEIGWEAGAGLKLGKLFIEAKYDNRMQQVVGLVGIYF